MPCVYCNKRNETVMKREEIAWQREDIIRVREKELQEKELALEEKRNQLNEENVQLKCEIERLLKLGRSNCLQKKSRKCSTEECATSALLENDNTESGFIFEEGSLLLEKEKRILEKAKNMKIWEQELCMKEQLLNDKKNIAEQERQLAFARNISIKDCEKDVDRKLKVLSEKKRSLDDREKLIIQKEVALTNAAAIMSDRETILHDRESSIIDKERNLVKSICEFISNSRAEESEQSVKQLEEIFKYIDKILNNKLSSLQQRENVVSRSEEVLVERWNKYFEAQGLLQAQEKKMAVSNICSNEKLMLKEWWPGQQDENVDKCSNFLETVVAEESYRSLLIDNKETIWSFPLSTPTATCTTNNSSFLHTLSEESEGSPVNNVQGHSAKENVAFSDIKMNSQCSEVSGDEFFQFYEKGKEELHNILVTKGTEEVTLGETNGCSEEQNTKPLDPPVQAFFDRLFCNKTPNEHENQEITYSLFQMNNKSNKLPEDKPETTKKDNDIFQGETQSSSVVVEPQEPNNAPTSFAFDRENSLPSHNEPESEQNVHSLSQRNDESDKLLTGSLEIVRKGNDGLQGETQSNSVVVDLQELSNVPGGSTFVSKDLVSYNDTEDQQLVCSLPQMNDGANKLPTEASVIVRKDNVGLQKEIQSNAVVVDSQNDVPCGSALVDKGSLSSKIVSLSTDIASDRHRDENSSSGALLNGSLQSDERNGHEETVSKKLEISNDIVNIESLAKWKVVEIVPEHHSEKSSKRDLTNNEKVSPKTDQHRGSSPNIECVSPDSSVGSRSSSVSSVSGRYSPFSVKRQKKPARDALLQAIANRNYLATVQLLDMKCLPLELRDDKGLSAVLLAVEMGNTDLVQRLINMGGDIKACDYEGNSALHIAVRADNRDMTIFLLQKGLSPHVTNNDGKTVVQLGSQLNKKCLVDVVNQFISAN